MGRAYDELYLKVARNNLAYMLQFAVYELNKDLTGFYNDFIRCGMAARFGAGESSVVAGMSGAEVAYEVVRRITGKECYIKPKYEVFRSPEYWTGWALAYYQWYSGKSFEEINNIVPISEIYEMYYPLHEADITKFVDVMDERMNKAEKTIK